MSDNKGLSAFINKNKKAKKTKGTAQDNQPNAAATAAESKAAQAKDDLKKNTPVSKDDSSDEEVDELEVANKQINVNIKENKDVDGGKLGEEKKKGFGYEDEQAHAVDKKGFERKQPTGGAISFGKPKFGNKKLANKMGFEDALDDLDDDGQKKEGRRAPAGIEGQKEFVNLGSQAKPAHGHDKEKEREEKKEAVKPTFKGKLNLTKTGGQPDDNQGVVKDYDFKTVYKRPHDEAGEEQKRERREGDDGFRGGRGGRKPRDKGHQFGKEDQQDKEDDGFQVVGKLTRKPHKKNHGESSSDEG